MMNFCKRNFIVFLRTDKPHIEYRGVYKTPIAIFQNRLVMSQVKRFILDFKLNNKFIYRNTVIP